MVSGNSYPSMQVRIVGDYDPSTMPTFQMVNWVGIDVEVPGEG